MTCCVVHCHYDQLLQSSSGGFAAGVWVQAGLVLNKHNLRVLNRGTKNGVLLLGWNVTRLSVCLP